MAIHNGNLDVARLDNSTPTPSEASRLNPLPGGFNNDQYVDAGRVCGVVWRKADGSPTGYNT